MAQRRTSSNLSASSSEDDCVLIIKDVEDLKKLVQQKKAGLKHSSTMPMFRVRPALRDLKPENYTPAQISLGLFDRFPLGSKRTIADKCRLEMASAFLEAIGMTEDDGWEKLCEQVVPNPKEMKDLYYDELDRNCLSLKEVQSVLTLDAIFLACYIGGDTDFASRYPSFEDIIARSTPGIDFDIIQDILQVENQFPLSLIHKVLMILFGAVEAGPRRLQLANSRLGYICLRLVIHASSYLPGFDIDDTVRISRTPFLDCDNFLDCVYRAIYHDLQPDSVSVACITRLPSVTELQRAGIKIRGRKGIFHDVRFEKGILKATLYLPIVKIYTSSEGLWRNLLAYEQGHSDWSKTDTVRYVKFMNDLIQDENDVIELTKGKSPVLALSTLGTNEAMVQFNSALIQSCIVFCTSVKWNLLEREILAYCEHPIRKLYVEFMKTYFQRPWITLSVVGVILVLILTFLQTLYTLSGYSKVIII